jgi:RNA polymerase-interacting CarD/CdnL/TRCF family regulator
MKDVEKYLAQLRKELQRGEDYDLEALQILDKLHQEISQGDAQGGAAVASMLDRIKALESRFASEHPALESAARELADALAKMGI